MTTTETKNVLGNALLCCCKDPVTGFYRDGYCITGKDDIGAHVICALITREFLDYTKEKGKDLVTPSTRWKFPGLKAGYKWCVCANTWKEAYESGIILPVFLESTHEEALKYIDLETLKKHAVNE